MGEAQSHTKRGDQSLVQGAKLSKTSTTILSPPPSAIHPYLQTTRRYPVGNWLRRGESALVVCLPNTGIYSDLTQMGWDLCGKCLGFGMLKDVSFLF